MRWNIKLILSLLIENEYKLMNENDDLNKCIILLDIISLLEKYYILTGKKYNSKLIRDNKKNYSSMIYELMHNQKKSSQINDNLIENNLTFLIKTAISAEEISHKYPKKIYIKKINEIEYLNLVSNFFKYINNDINNIFMFLKDGYINFSNKKTYTDKKGNCSFMLTSDKSFINIDYFYKNLETLPHEIAHAHEFSLYHDYLKKLNWHASTFVETYPNFIELAFADYCLNNNYEQFAFKILNYYFEEIGIYAEIFLDNLNTDNYLKEAKILLNFIFALFMFNIYKNDKNNFNDFLLKFQINKSINDSSIWSLIHEKDILETLEIEKESIKKLVNELKK